MPAQSCPRLPNEILLKIASFYIQSSKEHEIWFNLGQASKVFRDAVEEQIIQQSSVCKYGFRYAEASCFHHHTSYSLVVQDDYHRRSKQEYMKFQSIDPLRCRVTFSVPSSHYEVKVAAEAYISDDLSPLRMSFRVAVSTCPTGIGSGESADLGPPQRLSFLGPGSDKTRPILIEYDWRDIWTLRCTLMRRLRLANASGGPGIHLHDAPIYISPPPPPSPPMWRPPRHARKEPQSPSLSDELYVVDIPRTKRQPQVKVYGKWASVILWLRSTRNFVMRRRHHDDSLVRVHD